MKKLITALLTIALIIPLVLGGCADTTDTDTADTTDTTTTDTTDTDTTDTTDTTTTEPVELRLTTHGMDTALYQEWADKVAEATNGEVTVTIYPSGTLMGEADVLSGVKSGIADIGELAIPTFEDQFPLTNLLSLPFMPLGDVETFCQIWEQLIEEFPELTAEYADFKMVFWVTNESSSCLLSTTGAPAVVPEDIEGLKIMPPGTLVGEALSEVGAAPLVLEVTDWYTSLDTGLLEGMFMGGTPIFLTQVYTLMPYHTIFPSGVTQALGMMIMNLDSWNSLSAEAQAAIDGLFDWATESVYQESAANEIMALEAMEAEGHSIVTLTPEQEQLWYDATAATRASILADLDAQGLPATEIYERAIELAAEYAD